MVNRHREEMGDTALTKHPITTVIRQLKPLITKTPKRKQGNKDEKSPWTRSRWAFATQILVCLEKIKSEETTVNGVVPDCFKKENLPTLKTEQAAQIDETQHKCVTGGIAAGTREH